MPILPTTLISGFSRHPDLRQSERYAEVMKVMGWRVLGQAGAYIFLRKYGFVTLAKSQRSHQVDLAGFNLLKTRHNLIYSLIEPALNQKLNINLGLPKLVHRLRPFCLKVMTSPLAHTKTAILDLTQPEPEIFNSFASKTKYNLRLIAKQQRVSSALIQIKDLTATERTTFLTRYATFKKIKTTLYSDKFLTAILEAFHDSGWVHLTYLDGQLAAALLILKHNKSAAYFTAFSESNAKSLFCPTAFTWSAIKEAKRQGCDFFDFGGMFDERYPKMYAGWEGFTRFKDSFSPVHVAYPPSYALIGG